MSTMSVYVVGFICFTLGAIAGIYISRLFSANEQKIRDLEKHLHEKQDDIKSYQLEVTQHFSETAKLLKQLAESYRDVHNHLAHGAQELCESKPDEILEPLPDSVLTSSEPKYDENISAPLDYAPRATPYDRGTLNEDYGLEKVKLNEEPISDIAEAIAENAKTK